MEKNRDKLFNRAVAQRRALLGRAASVSDYGTCLRILRDEAELLGLYPAKTVNVTPGAKPDDGDLSADDRLAALARLRAQVDEGGGGAAADRRDEPDGPLLGGPGPHPE
jgi:hypothetical protein